MYQLIRIKLIGVNLSRSWNLVTYFISNKPSKNECYGKVNDCDKPFSYITFTLLQIFFVVLPMFFLTLLLYGGLYITPPTEKWQLLLKIMILKSPNFVTFPIYLWQTLPYLFWGSKWRKKGFLYSIFDVHGTNFRIKKLDFFLPFLRLKWLKLLS